MNHIEQTISEIDARVSRLLAVRNELAALLGHQPTPAPQDPPPSAPRKPTKRPARKAVPGRPKIVVEQRKPKPRGKLAEALEAVLPTFGREWFTVGEVKERVAAADPSITEEQLKTVCVRLIKQVDTGALESEGAGRDRKYRNPESYEDRKKRLGIAAPPSDQDESITN